MKAAPGVTSGRVTPPSAATPLYVPPRVAWYTVFVMFLLYVCSYMDRQVLTMLVEPIKHDLQVSDFEMSLLLGPVFAIFYTTLGIPAGWIADRFNRRRLIAIGAGLWAIATASSGLASTYGHLAMARLSVGIGEATLTPAAQSMIADQFPPKRLSLALSVYMLGVTFGSGLALGFSGFIIDWAGVLSQQLAPFIGEFRPWQVVFFIIAAPTVILAPLVFTVKETRTRAQGAVRAEPGAGRAFIRKHWRMLTPYYLGFGMTSIAVYALSSWVPAYMSRTFHISMAEVGVGYGLTMFLATGGGQIIWSIVVDWLYARGIRDAHARFHMFTWLLSAPAVFFAFTVHQPAVFLVLLGVFYLFTYAFQGYSIAGLQLVTPPEFRGRMSAAFLTYLNLIGLACGPTAVGALTDFVFHDTQMVGWAMAIVVLACAPVGMLLLWVAARQKRALELAGDGA
jgi:MFS family permease